MLLTSQRKGCYNEEKTKGDRIMIGSNIKTFRQKANLTQKELAEKLSVTPQAVSRWEKEEVEPSLDTINTMANLFSVSVDELMGREQSGQKTSETTNAQNAEEMPQKPVLAVCEQCNRPLYDGADIRRVNGKEGGETVRQILCPACDAKRIAAEKQEEERRHAEIVQWAKRHRIHSYVWSALASVATLAIGIPVLLSGNHSEYLPYFIAFGILLFPFLSCLILDNNVVEDILSGVASFGYVRFPGLIFELSLDGFLWLITVKLLFWLIGFLIATVMMILSVLISMILSVFIYPYALWKNINKPEED